MPLNIIIWPRQHSTLEHHCSEGWYCAYKCVNVSSITLCLWLRVSARRSLVSDAVMSITSPHRATPRRSAPHRAAPCRLAPIVLIELIDDIYISSHDLVSDNCDVASSATILGYFCRSGGGWGEFLTETLQLNYPPLISELCSWWSRSWLCGALLQHWLILFYYVCSLLCEI